MELTAAQGRVLGALVEKEQTTPQGYPLTDNALLAACNQTTSRDPIVTYDVATVRMAVRELRALGLVRTVHRTGERSDKHRHELESELGLSAPQVSLLAVLLLRGPHTLAELRARTERLHVFATVDDVERELAAMADRDEPLVGLLSRQPGRKEARFGQLMVDGAAPVSASAGGGRPGGRSWADEALGDPVGSRGSAEASGEPPRAAPGGWSASPDRTADASASADVSTDDGDGDVPTGDDDQSGLAVVVADLAEQVAALRSEVDALRVALERATGG